MKTIDMTGFTGVGQSEFLSDKQFCFGFTLAEVLITLGIIGIIAAMTLPALVNQYQKQVTVSKLKRFYTSVKQVETQVKADFGELNYVTNSFYPNGDLVVIDKFFKPYLKISKVCNNDCIYSYLDASSVSHDMSDKNGFYTSDGILVLISEFHIGYEWDSFHYLGCLYD